MDGVLADFDKAAGQVLGTNNTYKFEYVYGTEEFWRRLDAVPDFFLNFDPMPDAHLLWEATRHLNPVVLTALPSTGAERVDAQKRAWVAKHLGPDVRVITCRAKDKPRYCTPNSVLVDDRNIQAEPWRAAGGHFVLHTSAESSIEELRRLRVIS